MEMVSTTTPRNGQIDAVGSAEYQISMLKDPDINKRAAHDFKCSYKTRMIFDFTTSSDMVQWKLQIIPE